MRKFSFVFLLITGILGINVYAAGFPKISPNAEMPLVETPSEWSAGVSFISIDDPVVSWWQNFNDELLTMYIEDAVNHNYNLQAALGRINEARALRGGLKGNLYPRIDTYMRMTNTRFSERGANPVGQISKMPPDRRIFNIDNPTNIWDTGFDASWEIDFFGRDRWAIQQASERIKEFEEIRRAIIISIISEVARNYFELRGTQQQLVNLNETLALQEEQIRLLQLKLDIGLGTKLEIVQASTRLETLQAQKPLLKAQIQASAHQIAILTGRTPDALNEQLSELKPLPVPPSLLEAGLPEKLIERRPDIRQAVSRVNAVIAEAGAARAELYPVIGVRGGFGFESLKIEDIFKISSRKWSVMPFINWRIFERKTLKAKVQASQARLFSESANLRQTVLEALQEAETAISMLENAKKNQLDLEISAISTQKACHMTEESYKIGLSNYLQVLEARQATLFKQDELINSRLQTSIHALKLYKALGGGWEPFDITY